MTEPVLFVEREGAVACLTLNRPRSRNALTLALVDELAGTFEALGADRAVRAVVLTGAGGAFCSGADLKTIISEGPDLQANPEAYVERFHRVVRAIDRAPQPVVAAVEGPAAGFGCDLALACDLRVVAPSASFQEVFVRIGLMPDGGGTFFLPRLVGLGRALELMMLGDAVSGERALELGIANRLAPEGSLRREAMALATRLAEGPPLALARIKRASRDSLAGPLDDALRREREGQGKLLTTEDCMAAVLAWAQRVPPTFQGR
ncbi:MAG TPA: enoyl-CoA hydratase-related protein [Polyangiaceae bacterium]|nr:enoyl-CoA hydratase-related protein [Polyangiaceae bacterium]